MRSVLFLYAQAYHLDVHLQKRASSPAYRQAGQLVRAPDL